MHHATPPEPSIPVATAAMRKLLATARAGLSPRITWSENRTKMDAEAMQVRGEMLGEIESQLERLLSGS